MAPSATPFEGYSNDSHSSGSESEETRSDAQNTNEDSNPETIKPEQPIAIIGMGCRLPGDVSSAEEFWELCSRARSGWSTIPKNRFNHEAFHHPNPDKQGCYNPEGGHFLSEDVGLFDAPFFNLTEKEAISLDPQQRLLLECTYEALENGGIPKESLVGKNVGVYVGGSLSDYELRNWRDTDTAPMHLATGCAAALLANRLSYYFDLSGPSATVDTACSSSLTALHLACQSLRCGESSQAIVASCHLNILPDYFITMSMSGLFSDQGRSFAFDDRGTGFGRGEGVGCVILKPLDEALKANDTIRAVIVGSGMNQDGKTKGITMPSGEAQVSLMKSIYKRSGLDPSNTGYVEAHGTGTKVGDPIEASALHEVFGEGRTSRQPLFIGSVKSNIGHLEGASGIVSVIKTAMMLEKGFILPNYNFEKANSKIPFDEWNFKVPKTQRPWPRGKDLASINNFGFGGANSHVVMQKGPSISKTAKYAVEEPLTDIPGPTKKLYVLSAHDKDSLERQMHDLTIYLEQRPEVFQKSLMPDLAYTLGQRRSVLPYKVAIPTGASSELIATLAGNTVKPTRATKEPSIGFVFTGQGAQWHAMGRELLHSYPVFRSTIFRIAVILEDLGAAFSLIDELSKDAETSQISTAEISQPACTAIQLGLVDLLKTWGIRPSAVTGHSSGEIGAAYACGALSLEACVSIAYHRGQSVVLLKQKYPDLQGAMMAVGGSPEEIRSLIKTLRRGRATVACINSPSSVTVSGDSEAISELQEILEQKQMFNRKLRVDTAYHSHHMELVAEEYASEIRSTIPKKNSKVTFHSSLIGNEIKTSELGTDYWVQNLTCAVRFSEALQSMCNPIESGCKDPGVDALIEIGPHAGLEGPVKQTLKAIGGKATKIFYASALLRNKDAVETTLQLAATLFMKGVLLDFAAINNPIPTAKIPTLLTNLPKYSWNHSRKFWHESRIAENHSHRQFGRNDLVGTMANYSNDLEPTWRNIIRADDMPWVRHHKMQDLTVYPMAGYIAAVIEAAAQRATMRNILYDKFELREVTVSRPLVIQEGADVEVNVTLRAHAEGTKSSSDTWDEFHVFSWARERGWTEHCHGLISLQKNSQVNSVDGEQQKKNTRHTLAEKVRNLNKTSTSDVDKKKMYDELANSGAIYGELFQGITNCKASNISAVADMVVPNTASVMPKGYETSCIVHPAFLDLIIQMPFPICGAGWQGMEVLYMPSSVKSMSISTGITRKAGDRLRVFADGKPTLNKPSPTAFSLFAMSDGDDEETLISLDSLVMTPVFAGDDSTRTLKPRELCYKMSWEPALQTGDQNRVNLHEESAAAVDNTTVSGSGPKFAIICDAEGQDALVSEVSDLLSEVLQTKPVSGPLGSVSTEGKICIVLSELERPLISAMDPERFQAVQKLIRDAQGILWAVSGAYTDSETPDAQMVIGMARSIRSETLLKFATLDLDTAPQLSILETAKVIVDLIKTTFHPESPTLGLDMEYQERGGSLYVPRIVDDEDMNTFVHQETQPNAAPALQPFLQEGRSLKMAISSPGALDTLYFMDDPMVGSAMPDFEVEIEIKATSMNFKDVMVSMGQLNQPYIGIECAGIISAVGAKVTGLTIGDRVCAMSEGTYATHTRCLGTSVQKVPSNMSFVQSSTIPVVYCTAYYSLFDLGRLTEGESVLIHAAAGGVGQAAILLAQMIGAEIFATVGSSTKKEFLMKEYSLPESHIFYSRDTSFSKSIKTATNGRGVDVVINSLAGDQLRETWDSLAHFGRFIEIGKRDIVGNTRLEMARFEHNAMFASVDLTVLAAERPKTMKRLLSDVFELLSKNSIRPVSPITTFPISDVESAFRTLQSGKSMGKIVVVSQPDELVKAVPMKTANDLLRADATYIIIGGTGGLGRSMSSWMIQKGARNIVLLSRSGTTTGKVAELIDQAKIQGAKVVVQPCDVADKGNVERVVRNGVAGMPPIRGLIHAAMVLRDTLYEKMSWQEWDEVVEAKVAGAWNFHHALAFIDAPLDFFIAISSAAGAVGNRGQAAYAAANCFLNAFVQYRIKRGLPASSIDLTAVSDIGYLAENAERQAQVADNLGSETISGNEVLALLAAAIRGPMRQSCNGHCITGLKMGSQSKELFWADDAKFKYLKEAADAEKESFAVDGPTVSLSTAVKSSRTSDEAATVVCEGLMTKVSAVLMVPREEMDSSRPVVVYGLDSLVAIEIRNWITRELEASLQVLELLTSPSLIALAELIVKKSKLASFDQTTNTT
ncbi:polyketide synthase [Phlyctema vagabunda]|uniref:Polyketide synthase n=1 Tax=Phlyctema vagabunda TaxID=108571 RepID=A0ABR4PPL6_9HELO